MQVILREGFEGDFDFPVQPDLLSAAEFDRIRNTVHSQGILLLVKRPGNPAEDEPVQTPFVLLLDRISDPGNFGTIVRTARAVGLSEIAARMEAAAKEGNTEAIDSEHDQMMKLYDEVVDAISGSGTDSDTPDTDDDVLEFLPD